MRLAVKPVGFIYYDYELFNVYDVLCISDDPLHTMKYIQSKFKLKMDKIEEPDMYLGADLSKTTNVNGQEYWDMSSENYCTAAVTNLEYVFGKAWFKVSAKVCYPYELWLSSIYGCDRRAQCNGYQWYQ